MKRCEFYSLTRPGNDKEDASVTLRKGYTDGEYNYFYAGYKDWWCIDIESGLLITQGETKEEACKKARAKAGRIAQAKSGIFYKKCVENFNELRLYGGQCTLKQLATNKEYHRKRGSDNDIL